MKERKKIRVEEFFPNKDTIIFLNDEEKKTMGLIAVHEREAFAKLQVGDTIHVELDYGKGEKLRTPIIRLNE